ncbi:DUF4785 domain-containing protein [Shewanella sp. AS16]|uniref:DUF4785 domain-containing protein n=1 Tax=Shewanella sp. AS16 TaxID=2907625 RepID=UPI001F344EAA|nr:DUF4785 domain-containing protein [Shewanella sp. AS16]MCE9685528.1 DUF4785 domain-containing protein [Shewanella sp. AS16]
MQQLTSVVGILCLATLLTACQDESTPKVQTAAAPASPQNVKAVPLAAPQTTDIYHVEVEAPTLPPLNTSTDYISFITPLSGEFTASPPQTRQTRLSDEYWLNVSGAELSGGIDLPISQASSVIRIAPRGDTSSGGLIKADAIAPETISLSLASAKTGKHEAPSWVKSMADAQALASAGLSDDSSALTLRADAKPGKYRLRVKQPLAAQARYLVNVKEKHSPYQLKLGAPMSIEAEAGQIGLDISLSQGQQGLAPRARLIQAGGESLELAVRQQGETWQAVLTEPLPAAKNNADLSEIQVDIQTEVDGRPLLRSVKTAFKAYVNSAKLLPQADSRWQGDLPTGVDFGLELITEGRFGLSAVLTGTNSQGKSVAILKSQAAAWITPDAPRLRLELDPELIAASGLRAPFELRELTLTDQGQMARLSYQDHGLILE